MLDNQAPDTREGLCYARARPMVHLVRETIATRSYGTKGSGACSHLVASVHEAGTSICTLQFLLQRLFDFLRKGRLECAHCVNNRLIPRLRMTRQGVLPSADRRCARWYTPANSCAQSSMLCPTGCTVCIGGR